jgi:hypothetical protein
VETATFEVAAKNWIWWGLQNPENNLKVKWDNGDTNVKQDKTNTKCSDVESAQERELHDCISNIPLITQTQ